MKRVAIVLGAVCVLVLGWVLAEHQRSSRTDGPSEESVAGRAGDLLTPAQERELHRISATSRDVRRRRPGQASCVTMRPPRVEATRSSPPRRDPRLFSST